MFDTIVSKITGYFDKNTLISAFFPNLIFWGIAILVIEFLRLGFVGIESEWDAYTNLSPISQALIFIVFILWISFCSYLTVTLHPALIRLYEGYWPDIQPFKIFKDKMCSTWEHQWNDKNKRDSDLEKERIEQENKKRESFTQEDQNRILNKIDMIEEERLKIQYELFYRYPEKQNSENPNRFYLVPMPTELGNIIKAAELYSLKRYNLDAVLIWPRLVPMLPKDFVNYFKNSETSLLLMVTLSAFSLIFGIPISLLIGWTFPLWLTPLIPLIIIIVSYILRFYPAFLLALVSFITSIILYSFVIIHFELNFLQTWILQVNTISILLTIVLLISRFCYLSAVQAAFDYGDKIRSAIDLYRFKTLEGLNLQFPTTLEDELIIWEQVCSLLYRNYEVDPDYYQYISKDTTRHIRPSKDLIHIQVPVPLRKIPAYHLISLADIKEVSINISNVPLDAILDTKDLEGRISLKSLDAEIPILKSTLGVKEQLQNKIIIAFQLLLK